MPKTDENGVDWISEEELAQLKGCADENTFDEFIKTMGGRRIDELHENLDFPNADYIFPSEMVMIELKILESEIANTDQFRAKMDVAERKLYAKYKKTPLSLDPNISAQYLKIFIDLFRSPLARIVKKANSQIKSTKEKLGYSDFQGILLLVNDGLKGIATAPDAWHAWAYPQRLLFFHPCGNLSYKPLRCYPW